MIEHNLTVTLDTVKPLSLILSQGKAIVNHCEYWNDDDLLLAVEPNNTQSTRVDIVVLRQSWLTQTIRAAVIQGVPSNTIVLPEVADKEGDLREYPIAYITVAPLNSPMGIKVVNNGMV